MTRQRLMEMIADQLSIPADQISEESSVTDDLGADSLDIVEMLAALEEEGGVCIPDEDAVNMRTVGDVCAYVLQHISAEDWNENHE